jgi:hypothetical protein
VDDDRPTSLPALPLHAVAVARDGTLLKVRRRPGRPKKVRLAPDADELAYCEATTAELAKHVEAEGVVGTLRGGAGSMDVLQSVKVALAEESASLRWEIRRGRQEGRDSSQAMSRRIDALVKIALIELGVRRLGIDTLGADDPRLQIVLHFFLGSVGDVLRDALGDGEAEALIEKCRAALVGWEDRVLATL